MPSPPSSDRIQSAITLSLVDQARGGPFVFWDDLESACAEAAKLGFDGIEIFAPGPDTVADADLRAALDRHQLKLAAVGTGGGWVIHRWHLTHPDAAIRQQARAFIGGIIDWGARFGAPAIIGSMQGRHEGEVSRERALEWLAEALDELGPRAKDQGVNLLYEPLNRYETNLVNRVDDGVHLLNTLVTDNIRLLCDLFHMNIEEAGIGDALQRAGSHLGHVHFVDSNRQAAGQGHLDFAPIAKALHDIHFTGYASAEAFPLPDSLTAAQKTIEGFQRWLKRP